MKEKTLKSIVTAFLVLLVLWGASFGLGSMGSGAPAGGAGVSDQLGDLRPETVTSVTVQAPTGESTLLTSDGDLWTANGHTADADAIRRMLGALSEVEVGNVVATNPTNHARMGVSTDSAWTVTLNTSEGERAFLIGNTGRAFSSTYVRLPDEDEVVITTGDLRASLARPESDWRDKTIASVDTTRIDRIVVHRFDGEQITIQRGDSAWTVGEEPARQSTLGSFMTEISRITASGFVAEGAAVFEDNERVLRVEDSAGAVLAEVRFLGNGTTQHALLGSGGVAFQIPNWRVDRLTPTHTMAVEPTPGG